MTAEIGQSNAQPLFDKVALIGVGLIASSLAQAIRAKSLAGRVSGFDPSPAVAKRAGELNILDELAPTAAQAAANADLVVLAAPVGAMGDAAASIADALRPGAIVTDVGSVKRSVIDDVRGRLGPDHIFVPGHPIAGTEHSGPEAGFAELFEGRWCILTPTETTPSDAVEKVAALWTACGAKIDVMDADHHDLVLAITSHVPHLIAYNIVGTASDLAEVTNSEVIKYAAGGFRDFTRIAASDPTMWRDVFLNNRDAVLEMLGRFNEDLTALQRAIRRGDGDALFDLFTRTRAIRRNVIDAGQDTPAPDFGRNG
ncbi:MAG: prephenate/arogenate dehydrogenase family protein [Parvularculaceae bacterium]